MGRKAIFLDRDGTLIEDRGYLADPEGVVLLSGAGDALRLLQDAGYLLIVVTNQSGIGRGYFTLEAMHTVNARMNELLAEHGVTIDDIRYCPHGPDDGCACRKPLPGMLCDAAEAHGIDLAQSAMIGDQPRDAAAGVAAGCEMNFLIGTPAVEHQHTVVGNLTEALPRLLG